MDESLHRDEENLISYLDGEMPEGERKEFEDRLQREPELKEQLHKLQVAKAAAQQYGLSQKIRSIHAELKPGLHSKDKGKTFTLSRIVKYSMAAAASILVLVLALKLITANNLSVTQLYKEAYVHYDASGVRGSDSGSAVEKAYSAGQMEGVIEQARTQDGLSSRDSLLTGIAFLETNKADSSVHWLQGLAQQGPLRMDAEFYLSLAWLKAMNYEKAIALMKKIRAEEGHVYRQQFTEEYIEKCETLLRIKQG